MLNLFTQFFLSATLICLPLFSRVLMSLFVNGIEKPSLWNYLRNCNGNQILRTDLWMLFMYRKYSLRVLAVCNLHKKERNENCTLFCWLLYQYESGSITWKKSWQKIGWKEWILFFWLNQQFQSNEGMGKPVWVYRNETTIRNKLEHKLQIKCSKRKYISLNRSWLNYYVDVVCF